MIWGVKSMTEHPLSPPIPNRRDPRSGVVGTPVRVVRITDNQSLRLEPNSFRPARLWLLSGLGAGLGFVRPGGRRAAVIGWRGR